jgi:small GTP-binding protein
MNIDYSIAIFGSVSCGKSTLINSIFAKHLSQMNIRRTTMTPQVYNFNSKIPTHENDDEILLKNEEINSKFQVEIWDGKTINTFDSHFPPNFLPKNPNLNFKLYDLPGLNDQSTSHIYMKWASDNFHLFDCIILVIDINSGLNTSDEINICELIFSKMAEFSHVNLIILANKCDEIDYRNGQYIVCNREKEEIFNEQIIPTLNRMKEKHKIDEMRCNIIKFCSKNAFIYRIIQHNTSANAKKYLDENHLHEMIQLEVLRSEWLRLSDSEKEDKINCLIDRLRCDVEMYEKNMILSGFVKLKEILNNVVNNPVIIQPFYEKIIRNLIEKDDITKEQCLEYLKMIDSLSLDTELKSFLVQSIINFYVEDFYNDYYFGKNYYTINCYIKIFEDLHTFQQFEDYIISLKYTQLDIKKSTIKFFNCVIDNFLNKIGSLNNDILFIKFVDYYILPSFARYQLSSSHYIEKLITSFIRPDFWNNKVFFDWIFVKGWKNIKFFILSYITTNFSIASKENIFYLQKMSNQLRVKLEDVSIFCEINRVGLQHKINYSQISVDELMSFTKYQEKYGIFLDYLLEKIE